MLLQLNSSPASSRLYDTRKENIFPRLALKSILSKQIVSTMVDNEIHRTVTIIQLYTHVYSSRSYLPCFPLHVMFPQRSNLSRARSQGNWSVRARIRGAVSGAPRESPTKTSLVHDIGRLCVCEIARGGFLSRHRRPRYNRLYP